MLEAVALINAKPARLRRVVAALLGREAIGESYSVAGAFDLVATLRTRHDERLEELVTGEIAALEGVERTTTLVAFRCLSRREADGTFSLGLPATGPDRSRSLVVGLRVTPRDGAYRGGEFRPFHG